MALLLDLVPVRPLHARAASDNAGSLRVLQKSGFKIIGTETSFAAARKGRDRGNDPPLGLIPDQMSDARFCHRPGADQPTAVLADMAAVYAETLHAIASDVSPETSAPACRDQR